MNILLINPPRFNEIIGNNPSIIEEERGYNPPLGLLYIAGYIRKYTDFDISIIDAQVEKLDYTALAEKIRLENPDVVGITAMTMTLIDVVKTTRLVKTINPSIQIVLGGPHVNLFPVETINIDSVDYLVLGEGEETFKDLVEAIDGQSDKNLIPGIVFREEGTVRNTGTRPLRNDLDELPFPARRLVPYEKYNSILFQGKIATTIFTSRGCPFKCSFCDRPHLGKVFRARSAENVVDELEACVQLGIRDFLFYDDTFTVVKQRVLDICNLIVQRGLDIRWDIRARVDTVDEEILFHLKKAGCQGVHYGIESGSKKILKVLKKGISIDQAIKIFKLTRKYKMAILGYFMIGNPSETVADIQTTFKVIKRLKPDFIHMTILTPFPGTKIYNDGLASGVIAKDYWQSFAEHPDIDFVPPHWGEFFSKDELNKILVKGYRSFYINPVYILRRTLKVRTFNEFKKKFVAGLKVFRMKSV
jgi:radical SAM superfamily enzyme YgiQ (UPF0313 family)